MDAITESSGRYMPFSRKYDTVDRKYKFFNAPHAYRMQTYYPLIRRRRTSFCLTTPKSQISIKNKMEDDELMIDSNVEKEISITINDLPDDVLLTIFAYFHPIDLIHRFSLVSRHWNYLAAHPNFFTEVRVLINDLSLEYGSVKTFFQRISQHLRKICIDCSIPLPSSQVNSLFDICCPNVIHLDIGTFKEMNTTLLEKLSSSFPNVKTLHVEKLERSSKDDHDEKEWKKTLEMLFEDENIFPKMQNLFVGDVTVYCPEYNPKLPACKRPLNLLHIYKGTVYIDRIKTSPWLLTLTELHIESFAKNEHIEYISQLQNLKVFSWASSRNTYDYEFAHLKKLYNLEELRIWFRYEYSHITTAGLINLFTLPEKEPNKSFPFKLKHLIFANFFHGSIELFKVIDRNCPNLKTLGLPFNDCLTYNDVVFTVVKNFKRLIFLDLSSIGCCSNDEAWNNLNDDDLPDLRLLKLHGSKINIETFQRLNLKRPKLLISTKWNYFINWTETENGYVFHDTFDGDIRAIVNDLRQIEGLRDFTIDSYYNFDLDNLKTIIN
ncbi:F-box protein [Dirofilaria immitis]